MRFNATSFSVFLLNAKGEKLRRKQLDQPPLVYFKTYYVWTCLFYQNPLNSKRSSLITKLLSCGGATFIMGKGGAFGFLIKTVLKNGLICKTKVFWHRSKKMILFCENKSSGGKTIQICQILYLFNPCLTWLLYVVMLVLFKLLLVCWHESQKGGDWKGNMPLGHCQLFWWLNAPHITMN
jgi:hypothetical protein